MRVGLNLLYLLPGVVGGTETYAAGLIGGFSRVADGCEFVVFVNREAEEWPLPEDGRFHRVVCGVAASNRLARYRFEQTRLPRLVREHGVDLLHSLGYVAPLRLGVPSVVSIHDLNFEALADRMSPARRWVLRFFVRQAAKRASRILTLSEFSKGEIVRAFGIDPDRVEVVYLAARSLGSAAPQHNPSSRNHVVPRGSPFILAFSSQSAHKNISRLVQAFQEARHRYALPHSLVLVGHPPNGTSVKAWSDAGVVVAGHVNDATLDDLLGRAEFLVFPSLYEGFGLPVVEAMSAGLPVACSSVAALPEIAGGAAFLFDPTSVESIAGAIATLAGDPGLRRSLGQRGTARARAFSWEATAVETIRAYRRCLGLTVETPCGDRDRTGVTE